MTAKAKNAFSSDTCSSLSTNIKRERHVFLPTGGELEVNARCGGERRKGPSEKTRQRSKSPGSRDWWGKMALGPLWAKWEVPSVPAVARPGCLSLEISVCPQSLARAQSASSLTPWAGPGTISLEARK